MKRFISKRKSKVLKLSETVDRLTEAVTYAEVGIPEEAISTLRREAQETSKILVVGRGYTFSRGLRDYAVGLAGRLGYEIVAVNSRNTSMDFLHFHASFRDRLRQDFITRAEEAAAEFETQAKAAGIAFTHIVKFGEGLDVIKELHQEFKKLEYVVTEPDEDATNPDGVAPAIPVFSLSTNW
ncbi:MAG: hypothetical protein JRG97_04450 [Deltaproteobacteria bacterium]|nr:hypothetical protein [Deltaproteobacteria bacterium]MBW2051086.1 hypothetical protein [Deltaproteobacteria bacterium]MBW2140309.1 hypothetical protein [Deltaproteobacteria bacterium]MBW2322900.1 hypothetical protein [Deltaproteobacteria bacterium]